MLLLERRPPLEETTVGPFTLLDAALLLDVPLVTLDPLNCLPPRTTLRVVRLNPSPFRTP